MTRTCTASVIVLVSAVLAACGGRGPRTGPGADAAGQTSHETAQGPVVEEVGVHDVTSESYVAELAEEIDRLERECVPANGVSREVVEARFGDGRPYVNSKMGGEAPADSPHRAYEFCEDGVLLVRYDDDWNVSWAHFGNPYSSKGAPVGRTLPLETRDHEVRQRLAQIRRIRDEYRARYGE